MAVLHHIEFAADNRFYYRFRISFPSSVLPTTFVLFHACFTNSKRQTCYRGQLSLQRACLVSSFFYTMLLSMQPVEQRILCVYMQMRKRHILVPLYFIFFEPGFNISIWLLLRRTLQVQECCADNKCHRLKSIYEFRHFAGSERSQYLSTSCVSLVELQKFSLHLP